MFNSPAWAAVIDLNLANGLVDAVSKARLAPYGMGEPGNTPVDVIARHGRNIVLSESMYPVLHLLEVVMRNSIHDSFSNYFTGPDWYDEPWLQPGHRIMVEAAKSELSRLGKTIVPDRVVAELKFGFWCGMFHSAYETRNGAWPMLLPVVLPRVPKSWRTRPKVKARVESARAIRNRVFHHEPITNFPNLIQTHRELVEVLGWFSPEARKHLEAICRFKTVFADRLELTTP